MTNGAEKGGGEPVPSFPTPQDAGYVPGAGVSGPPLRSRIWPGFRLFCIAIGAGGSAPGGRVNVASFYKDFGRFRPPRFTGRSADPNPKISGGRGPRIWLLSRIF